MSLRRTFLLGAAVIATIAAFVAIATVLTGSFGETEGEIFATLAVTFVAGSTLLAGIACLERGSHSLGIVGAVLAPAGFLLWTDEVWQHHHSSTYWKLLWLLLIWTLATLLMTTTRLMTRSPDVLRRLFRPTAACATLAAVVASTMVLRDEGDGWQLFAVFLILAVLGATLTPILQRFTTGTSVDAPRERVLAVTRGAEVVALRASTRKRVVRIDGRDLPVADDEIIVVRPAPTP
jgi:hypothetical protein